MSNPVRIGDAELWLGDARDILPTLGNVCAEVIDPPYGIGEAGKNFASRGKLASADKYERADWDDEPINAETMALLRLMSRYQVIFGGNYYDLPPSSCWLVWDKDGPANDFADCELAWTNLPKAVRRLRYLWNGCMRKERDEPRVHPTQKPVGVMRWCIGHLPPDVKTIRDSFMGSGTTGVAAVQLGKRFIGIERDPKHFASACRRIEEAYRQPDMFVQRQPAPVQEALL